jgi:hypothetical protein
MSGEFARDEPEAAKLLSEARAALEVGLQMRKAQRAYFAKGGHGELIESKRLEVAFDLRLAQMGLR